MYVHALHVMDLSHAHLLDSMPSLSTLENIFNFFIEKDNPHLQSPIRRYKTKLNNLLFAPMW